MWLGHHSVGVTTSTGSTCPVHNYIFVSKKECWKWFKGLLLSWFLNMQSNCLLPVGLQGEACSVHQAILQRGKHWGSKRLRGPSCWWNTCAQCRCSGEHQLPAPTDVSCVQPETFCPLGVSRIESGCLTQLPMRSPHHCLVCFSAAVPVARGVSGPPRSSSSECPHDSASAQGGPLTSTGFP